MPVSIADVARRASVSISTVSRVLNRRDLVNEKTRARVEDAIRDLGYQPNAFARGLMLKRSEIIGLVLPDLHGEFYSEIIRGANAQARESGYNLVVASARDGDDSHSLLDTMKQRTLLDGVIVMVSEVTDRTQEIMRDFRVPFVVLDGDIEGVPHDAVVIDQKHGAGLLMRHLIEARRARRVVFVGGPATNVDTIARYETCRAALIRANLPAETNDVHYLDYEFDTAFNFARPRVAGWAGAGSFVFAANDEIAAGIVTAAAESGVRVPAQLGVVGFDDTRVARMIRPRLTTVHVPMEKMGRTAVELLIRRLEEPSRPSSTMSLQPELVVRESCGAGGE